jgi:hypothetical protein
MTESNFDFDKPTKVLVHGWTSGPNESFPTGIRDGKQFVNALIMSDKIKITIYLHNEYT